MPHLFFGASGGGAVLVIVSLTGNILFKTFYAAQLCRPLLSQAFRKSIAPVNHLKYLPTFCKEKQFLQHYKKIKRRAGT